MSSSHLSALVERYGELHREYRLTRDHIATLQRHSDVLLQSMSDCIELAEKVFDIKLSDYVAVEAPPSQHSQIGPSVKDYVLQAVEQAWPRPIRMADIHRQLVEMGYQIHPKTVGMNLFRWSRNGRVRCQGKQWYFVPPSGETEPNSHSNICKIKGVQMGD